MRKQTNTTSFVDDSGEKYFLFIESHGQLFLKMFVLGEQIIFRYVSILPNYLKIFLWVGMFSPHLVVLRVYS